jgi:anaerobic selenocysteine-containing dehydrogenase
LDKFRIEMSQTTIVHKHTACNRDCPDACGIIATIENDRVIRLQGDPDHPITRGFLCHRTSRFLDRQYDPSRLTAPLIRRGSNFQSVSWEEALDAIAAKMLQIREQSGGAAILHYRCGGSLGIMKNVTDYFFERFGPVTIKSGDVCTGAGDAAQIEDFGEEDSHDVFDLLNSKTIVIWGKNLYVSSVHLLPILREAKQKGARLILIDPVYHRTAELCELYVQPRPGGDLALALGLSRFLFDTEQADKNAATYCDHLDEFKAMACSRSLEEWAQLAGVASNQIEALGDLYAKGPSAILVGWGMQRRRRGSSTIRALDALGAISGNLGIPGGGVSFYFKRRGAFDLSFVQGDSAAPRSIPEPLLGPGILAASDPPIRMAWVTAANPVAMLPESRTVEQALQSRELTVVVDSFLTDTARCAHIVLPTTTMLEDDDLLGAYGHHWLVEMRPVVQPPAEVKTDYRIVQELARRVGLEEEFSDDVETWKRRLLTQVAHRGASLEDLRRGPVHNPLVPNVLFADRKFATATGRVNLIREAAPQPPSGTPERPLLLMAFSTAEAQSSQWPPQTQQGPATAIVHPDAAPSFRDGEQAMLQSDLGELTVVLKFDTRQRMDVVLMEKGGWLSAGRCANALVRAELTDAGKCAVYYDTPVRIMPIR